MSEDAANTNGQDPKGHAADCPQLTHDAPPTPEQRAAKRPRVDFPADSKEATDSAEVHSGQESHVDMKAGVDSTDPRDRRAGIAPIKKE